MTDSTIIGAALFFIIIGCALAGMSR